MRRRHETPLPRTNPSGKKVWVARYTGRDGKRRSAGTFALKRDAQDAIDAAYDRIDPPRGSVTVGGYFAIWLEKHPRAPRTEASYVERVRYVLDVELDGLALRDWPMDDIGRMQAVDLVDHLLRVQGRAAKGARGVLGTLATMWQDAMDDGRVTSANPFLRLRVRASDPRVRKPPRPVRIWSWEQMHALCAAGGLPVEREDPIWEARLNEWRRVYAEPMLRVFSDTGARLGEVLPLERADVHLGSGRCDDSACAMSGPHLHIRRTAWKGAVTVGTKMDHGEAQAGRACPLAPALAGMLAGLPPRIDTRRLFPSVKGRLFADRNFYRDVWQPARVASGVDATPHQFRHSYVSLMRAAGVDPADLAKWTGHTVMTATTHYTHSTGRSVELARGAVG